jgi:hypothetical protein
MMNILLTVYIIGLVVSPILIFTVFRNRIKSGVFENNYQTVNSTLWFMFAWPILLPAFVYKWIKKDIFKK